VFSTVCYASVVHKFVGIWCIDHLFLGKVVLLLSGVTTGLLGIDS
jgi:hypothetical protein